MKVREVIKIQKLVKGQGYLEEQTLSDSIVDINNPINDWDYDWLQIDEGKSFCKEDTWITIERFSVSDGQWNIFLQ